MRKIKFYQALDEAILQAVKLDKNVFIYGLGVNKTTKVFKTCNSVTEKYPNNIFDTPAAEQALTSFGAGAANAGLRPVLIHQRIDFMIYTLDQVINWMSLWNFKSNGKKKMPEIDMKAIVPKFRRHAINVMTFIIGGIVHNHGYLSELFLDFFDFFL